MPRIIGVEIPGDKRIDIALRYIYGIGPTNAKVILEKANVDPATRANYIEVLETLKMPRRGLHVPSEQDETAYALRDQRSDARAVVRVIQLGPVDPGHHQLGDLAFQH